MQAMPSIMKWITDMRSAASQIGEWTPELENQYQVAHIAWISNPFSDVFEWVAQAFHKPF